MATSGYGTGTYSEYVYGWSLQYGATTFGAIGSMAASGAFPGAVAFAGIGSLDLALGTYWHPLPQPGGDWTPLPDAGDIWTPLADAPGGWT